MMTHAHPATTNSTPPAIAQPQIAISITLSNISQPFQCFLIAIAPGSWLRCCLSDAKRSVRWRCHCA